jgi:ribulose-phosphate 3-epimerase
MTSLDVILLMGYPAGVGGQKFDDKVLEKIKRLKEMREADTTPFKICVDGGVDFDNIKRVKMAGADEVVIGKRLIGDDIEVNFEKFIKALY